MSVGFLLEDLRSASELNTLSPASRSPLFHEVERALGATGHAPLRNLHLCQQGSTVILHGHVPSYYLKQLAQATAMTIPGVSRVHNQLDVISGRKCEVEFARAAHSERLEARPR